MRILFAVVLALGIAVAAAQPRAQVSDPENTLFIDLESGRVVVRLLPDLAPNHVERVKRLAREAFYDGVPFHRVIDSFMVQTGDPTGTGTGGSSYPDLEAEFSDRPFERGVVGMARSSEPNSANSQFFIMLAAAPHLNGQYTVFGEVIEGMEFVDQIKKGDRTNNGLVEGPDRIVRMQVAADSND